MDKNHLNKDMGPFSENQLEQQDQKHQDQNTKPTWSGRQRRKMQKIWSLETVFYCWINPVAAYFWTSKRGDIFFL